MKEIWQLLGPDEAVRIDRVHAVVSAFYERVRHDALIGFFFTGKDIERLIELEIRFTTRLLGGSSRYEGRSIVAAHAKLPILSGHFDRRQQILRETLADQAFPEEAARMWLDHNERLRGQVIETDPPTRRPPPGET